LSCAMSGRDIIGLAETGSGKTLSYTLPLCMFLETRQPCLPGEGPVALILTPTRELMRQVSDHVWGLLKYLSFSPKDATFRLQKQSYQMAIDPGNLSSAYFSHNIYSEGMQSCHSQRCNTSPFFFSWSDIISHSLQMHWYLWWHAHHSAGSRLEEWS